ncbi:mRNA-decapping enzyme 1B isoform X2 [Nematostella vectensis]|nr:mRNA-decapping enzyme 1B isoform X2 [Nematostella vectensis]
MNRLNMNNIMEPITRSMEFKMQDPFLLFRNKTSGIFGIWFYAGSECVRLSDLLIRLSSEEPQVRPPSEPDLNKKEKPQGEPNGKVDIMQMFAKAQEKYDKEKSSNKSEANAQEQKPTIEEQKQQQSEQLQQLLRGPEPSRKTRSYSTPVAPSPSVSTSGMSIVTYCQDNGPLGLLQAMTNTKQASCTQPGRPVEEQPSESPRTGAQRKLFGGDKTATSNTITAALSTLQTSQDTPQKSMEQAANAASLMSPMAFKAPPKVSAAPSPIKPLPPKLEISPLTADQMAQSMTYLLKNDPDFVRKLHEAYLKSLHELLPT